MSNTKLSWSPCAICDQPDGKPQSHRHVTPTRYSMTLQLLEVLNERESKALQAAAEKEICGTCRNRLYMRSFRQDRRAKGMPDRQKPMREWKP